MIHLQGCCWFFSNINGMSASLQNVSENIPRLSFTVTWFSLICVYSTLPVEVYFFQNKVDFFCCFDSFFHFKKFLTFSSFYQWSFVFSQSTEFKRPNRFGVPMFNFPKHFPGRKKSSWTLWCFSSITLKSSITCFFLLIHRIFFFSSFFMFFNFTCDLYFSTHTTFCFSPVLIFSWIAVGFEIRKFFCVKWESN